MLAHLQQTSKTAVMRIYLCFHVNRVTSQTLRANGINPHDAFL